MGKVRGIPRFCISLNLFFAKLSACVSKLLQFLRSVSFAKLSQSFSSSKESLSPFENVACRQLLTALSFHKRGRKTNICEGIPVETSLNFKCLAFTNRVIGYIWKLTKVQ